MSSVKPIPDGYHSVTPYLAFKNADAAIKWYEQAFGAKELYRLPMPGGRVGHAEIQIGDSRLMLSDEFPSAGSRSAETLGGSPISLAIYVEDVDHAFERAVQAGGTVKRALTDQFYGDRSGTLMDPFGYQWTLATHIEDVSSEEMERRMQGLYASA